MRVTTSIIFLFFVLGFASPLKAQYYFYDNNYFDRPLLFELGASVGGMNCLTDLGGKKGKGKKLIKDVTLKNTQVSAGLYFAAIYKNAIGIRMEATFGQVNAYDSILKKVAPSTFGRYERNLSFRSSILEVAANVELYPLSILGKFDDEREPSRLSPYVLAGLGLFHFQPQAKLNNIWVDLQSLRLEGQGFSEYPDRKNYKLTQLALPVGIGVKYDLSRILNVRAEFVYRILTTDYLDDVSEIEYIDPAVFSNYLTGAKLANALLLYDRRNEIHPEGSGPGERGNPKNNDSYYSFNLKLGLILGRSERR